MAIDLPPLPAVDVASQQAAAVIRASDDDPLRVTLENGEAFRIFGNSIFSQQQIARTYGAQTEPLDAEDAARRLAQAYLDAGHLLVSVTWRPDPYTGSYALYVHEGRFGEINVPSDLEAYFAPYRDGQTPDANTFRRRALLATNHAELAGFTPFSTYETADPESANPATDMDIKVKLQPVGQTVVSASASNTGNRFVGEYFAGLNASRAWSAGYRIRAGVSQALSGEGSSRDDGDLTRLSAGFDWISQLGLLNLDYSNTDYDFVRQENTLAGTQLRNLDGETETIRAAFGTLLFAGNATRWTAGAAIETIDDQLRDEAGTDILDERYQIAELETSYARRLSGGTRPVAGAATIKVRQSIGSDIEPTPDSNVPSDSADDSFSIAMVALSASRNLSDTWSIQIKAEQQFAADPLPQNEEWVLGGFNRLPAYLPGVLVGDNGGYQTIKLNWSDQAPQQRIDWLSSLSANVFVERGSATFRDTNREEATIVDAGLRVTAAALQDRISLSVVYAESLDETNVPQSTLDQLEADVFFSLNASF